MSGFNRDGYQTIEQKLNPMWDPCQKKDAQGNKTILVPSENSWIAGYYLGMKIIKGKDGKDINVHDIQLQAVGDMGHLSEPVEAGQMAGLWGKTALDENLVKNVMIGTSIIVTWKGKTKSAKGFEYHTFDVAANPNDVLTGVAAQNLQTLEEEKKVIDSNNAGALVSLAPSVDDDLPF